MMTLPLIERAYGFANRIAVRSGSTVHTYADIAVASETIAGALLAGCSDLCEERVAFMVVPGSRYIATQWGIWRAGGVAVPLSLSATDAELEYTLTDSQATIVVASSEHIERIQGLSLRPGMRLITIDDACAGESPGTLPDIEPGRRAMMLYTSGTTSRPKGVVTTHACVQAQIESLVDAWHWQAEDRIPLFLPLHHIHGIINVQSCALWSGAEIEAFPRFELNTVLERVAARAWSLFMAVPTIYVKLIEALDAHTVPKREPILQGFAAMRLMVSGSAALPASVHRKWTALTGQSLLERYGMTEIGMALSNPYDGERRPGAVGQPLPGVEIRLQQENGPPVCGEGATGEIQVRGPNVFLEYWNRSEATRDSFIDGWFRTGDMAVIEDGYYRIMGRTSVDIIKSGGYKLSALEIEAALLDHPAIRECAVVGIADETWGEAVVAAVVVEAGITLNLDELRTWCKDRMSHYKVPRLIRVVDSLPRNAMGKVTKPAVSRLFDDSGVKPAQPTQIRLAGE